MVFPSACCRKMFNYHQLGAKSALNLCSSLGFRMACGNPGARNRGAERGQEESGVFSCRPLSFCPACTGTGSGATMLSSGADAVTQAPAAGPVLPEPGFPLAAITLKGAGWYVRRRLDPAAGQRRCSGNMSEASGWMQDPTIHPGKTGSTGRTLQTMHFFSAKNDPSVVDYGIG